jgi:nucleoside-diphosphate-sugar epimerase
MDPYSQRTTDLVAIETGLEVNVKTYLVMSPTIYGTGSGLFNRSSIQLPNIIRTALKTGQVSVIGAGDGVWDAVHMEDLELLYELLLSKVLSGEEIPSGHKGIYFSETGDFTWMSLAQGLAEEMYRQGALPTADVKQMTLEEGAKLWANNLIQYAELGYASK